MVIRSFYKLGVTIKYLGLQSTWQLPFGTDDKLVIDISTRKWQNWGSYCHLSLDNSYMFSIFSRRVGRTDGFTESPSPRPMTDTKSPSGFLMLKLHGKKRREMTRDILFFILRTFNELCKLKVIVESTKIYLTFSYTYPDFELCRWQNERCFECQKYATNISIKYHINEKCEDSVKNLISFRIFILSHSKHCFRIPHKKIFLKSL